MVDDVLVIFLGPLAAPVTGFMKADLEDPRTFLLAM